MQQNEKLRCHQNSEIASTPIFDRFTKSVFVSFEKHAREYHFIIKRSIDSVSNEFSRVLPFETVIPNKCNSFFFFFFFCPSFTVKEGPDLSKVIEIDIYTFLPPRPHKAYRKEDRRHTRTWDISLNIATRETFSPSAPPFPHSI